MLILGGGCAVLVEQLSSSRGPPTAPGPAAPRPYASLADDELSPVDLEDAEIGNYMFS